MLTENIRLINDNPKPYHFSNECDMLNLIVLGMTAKQVRVLHGIEKKTSIRPYLTQEQINMLEVLQKADIGLLLSVPDFHTTMADKYNAEGYFSPTEHEAFTRLENEEKADRKAAAFRPIVYICSPYSGDTERNIKNAKRYSRFAVDKHYLPIAPHIYFTQFMDNCIPEERDTAIFMNWVLMSKCVELWVFGENISAGMKAEIDRAKRKHMRIRYFTEELEEKL